MDEIVESLAHPSDLEVPCILLLLAEHATHGYQLVVRLRDFGLVDKGTGRVYRELRQLEQAGLVRSTWEATQMRGPARRVYQLTRSGTDVLAGCAEAAAGLARTLECYTTRARGARVRPPPVRLRRSVTRA